MKIKFLSEDHPGGLEVDWPTVPGEGSLVAFNYRGGTSILKVLGVRYDADADGNLQGVEVHLTY
ncbi:MAG: hypothetical protein WBA44_05085 [Mesorhizobium sp.]